MSDKAEFNDSGIATKTGNATCYSFEPFSGEYNGSFEFMTLIGSGIPASSTLIEPPPYNTGKAVVFNNGMWDVFEDHRNEMVYSTVDGSELKITVIGPYPENITAYKPNSPYDVWDGDKWVIDMDAKKQGDIVDANATKKYLLTEASNYTQVWQTQLMLGIISDDDKLELIKWMKYHQALQGVDINAAPSITWPKKP